MFLHARGVIKRRQAAAAAAAAKAAAAVDGAVATAEKTVVADKRTLLEAAREGVKKAYDEFARIAHDLEADGEHLGELGLEAIDLPVRVADEGLASAADGLKSAETHAREAAAADAKAAGEADPAARL